MLDELTTIEALALRERLIAERETDILGTGSSPTGRRHLTLAQVREGLLEAGHRRAVARAVERDANADLMAWVDAALALDMDKSAIAQLSGLSRRAVYDRIG